MSLGRPVRKSTCGLVSYRAAIMCVAILIVLVARIAPPGFPDTPPPSFRNTSLSLAFGSHADLAHRQCFDREDSPWVTSPSIYADWSTPVFSPHPTHTPELFVEIVTDGWHYNRPPPIS